MTMLKESGPAKQIRKRINELEEKLRSLEIKNGFGYTAKRLATGTTLQIKIPRSEPGVPNDVQRFKITAIAETYLTCRKVDATGAETDGIDHNVMRPYETKTTEALPTEYVSGTVTTTDTQNRTFVISITAGGSTKTLSVSQRIFPPYTAGDFIFGIKPVTGGTVEVNGEQLDWLDLNIDARHWDWKEVTVEVCVNNTIKYMVVKGSSAA